MTINQLLTNWASTNFLGVINSVRLDCDAEPLPSLVDETLAQCGLTGLETDSSLLPRMKIVFRIKYAEWGLLQISARADISADGVSYKYSAMTSCFQNILSMALADARRMGICGYSYTPAKAGLCK